MTPPDGGLQAERTTLAWQRTGLGVLGTAALLAHTGRVVAWAVTLLIGVGLLVGAEDRLRRVRGGVATGAVAPARAMAAGLTGGVLVVAALAVVVVLRA